MSSEGEKLGIGIIGLGFMGQTHLGAYRRADEAGFGNRLVAVCDADQGHDGSIGAIRQDR